MKKIEDFNISPYSGKAFSEMSEEEISYAYAHFVCLYSVALSKIYKIDFKTLDVKNFEEVLISKLEGLPLINFYNDCLKYIDSLNNLQNASAFIRTPDLLMPKRCRDLINKINDAVLENEYDYTETETYTAESKAQETIKEKDGFM